MNIVMVGAGKLGLPVALAIESKGHKVVVVDPDARVGEALATHTLPYHEPVAQEMLQTSAIRWVPLADAIADADIVFIAVQTPHAPEYEGATPLPTTRADFDYTALIAACVEVSMALPRATPIAIISTVLPGTMEREILPRVSHERFALVYNPAFIAMGTTAQNFLAPEFTLLGVSDPHAASVLRSFYESLHDRIIFETTIRNAELIKVAYNTFIGMKIVFANTMMEISHKLGCDVDSVMDALCLASQRLTSPAYMSGGMGDGGGGHPRDNIAMSWLARDLELSCNLFDDIMVARESQSAWLGQLTITLAHGLPIVLLGESFKRNSAITTGSAARLLSAQLIARGVSHGFIDPHVSADSARPDFPCCFVVSANHDCWHNFPFRTGDVVVDPWRAYGKAAKSRGATYIGVGAA